MGREEVLARGEVARAYGLFVEVQKLRAEAKLLGDNIRSKLSAAKESLKAVQQLRYGKDTVVDVVGRDNVYLPDLLRLFDGDERA